MHCHCSSRGETHRDFARHDRMDMNLSYLYDVLDIALEGLHVPLTS